MDGPRRNLEDRESSLEDKGLEKDGCVSRERVTRGKRLRERGLGKTQGKGVGMELGLEGGVGSSDDVRKKH